MTGRCALLLLLALLGLQAEARGGRGHGEWDTGDVKLPPLPPREDAARVARFVTHVSGWGALATISANPAVRGRPFVDVLSLSDGPPGSGSGVPYFYLSPLMQTVQDLQVNETELDFAKTSLFTRHPAMKTWPSSHNWFFAKLNITNIWVVDYFGGAKVVTPEEYYNVTFHRDSGHDQSHLLSLSDGGILTTEDKHMHPGHLLSCTW
ncbi:protein CREG1 isoform X3 [Erinaceus europaeus]|uniref:Protein CREG1 isoform X3 n=1 Tax=Erinaceus europaeus TaxID=9365 RepID=A0ABM3XYP4_ERIEU|nr:protein CREG1 isoform X3 [Erinaceus europaeus]